MNKLFEWLDQIETIIYAIAEFDAGDMSYDDFLLTGGRLKKTYRDEFYTPDDDNLSRKKPVYKDIAQEIARQKGISSMSAQAIGGAVGHNPISIIIPCHRVIGSNGNLTGYAGGLDRKINLLALEGADIAKYLISTTDFIHVKKTC